jgi:uncharacterized protein (DUF1800 family)
MRIQLSRRHFLKLASAAGAIATIGAIGVKTVGQELQPVVPITLTSQHQASRFLTQATLGPTAQLIEKVSDLGIEDWIENQFNLPIGLFEPLYFEFEEELGPEPEENELHYLLFKWCWWTQAMAAQDVLRQRIALALSEIFVISLQNDELEAEQQGVSNYYDMLLRNSFGNFRDLLFDVTMHPCMGFYLSHLRNRKANPSENRFPDENYAREVMQLFSIGLFELNQDGSRKLDGNGNTIPTYGNEQIREFAKVFTGLTFKGNAIDEEEFLYGENDYSSPMEMYEPEHQPSTKNLLRGSVLPAGQSGIQDINDAIDNLFNHENVGPFFGRLLIQRLITSNPSPEYISRVADVFANNGQGVRGDMQAVIKSILLDEEARSESFMSEPTHGKLREPIVRYTHLLRAMKATSEDDKFRNAAWWASDSLKQHPMHSPTVFNFFLPDFQPLGSLSDAGLVAPEFQITTSVSAITAINFFDAMSFGEYAMEIPEEDGDYEPVMLDLDIENDLANNPEALLDHLDLVMTYGKLSTEMRQNILNTISHFEEEPEYRVMWALYLIMNSPEFAVLT